jgi:hypothetical protein
MPHHIASVTLLVHNYEEAIVYVVGTLGFTLSKISPEKAAIAGSGCCLPGDVRPSDWQPPSMSVTMSPSARKPEDASSWCYSRTI